MIELAACAVIVTLMLIGLCAGGAKLETPTLQCDRCHRWRSVKALAWDKGDDGPHCDGGCR